MTAPLGSANSHISGAIAASPSLVLGMGLLARRRDFVRKYNAASVVAGWIVGSCLILSSIAGASESAEPRSGISVRDAIEMTRLVQPSALVRFREEKSFHFSPEGTRFAIITEKGNLDRDTITFEILVFDVKEVSDYVVGNDPIDTGLGYPVVSMESAAIKNSTFSPLGISNLRWMSESTVAFVGQRGVSPTQVYSVDIPTREVTQLTDHDRHVKRFDVSDNSGTLVFVAEDDGIDRTAQNLRGYAVESGSIFNSLLLAPSMTAVVDNAYFALELTTGKVTPLTAPGHSLVGWSDLWLSPTGRWAVALANATDLPVDWIPQYAALGRIGEWNNEYEGNPALKPIGKNVRQYVRIDTATGEIRPLLSAPVSWGRYSALWGADGHSVILSNTHLPLDDADDVELEVRRNSVSVVEVDVRTGQYSTIGSYPWERSGGRLHSVRRPADDILVVEYAPPGRDEKLFMLYRRMRDGKWVLQDDDTTPEMTAAISVVVEQDADTPPELLVTDNITGRTKRVTDFNPTLRDKIVNRVEHFEWTDDNDRSWEGGLLYPPDYRPTQRYPLVIQTYGYSPDEFLIDGPNGVTSSFAARPLASQGIIVLQMHHSPSSNGFRGSGPDEGPNFVAAFEGAVRVLDKRGTIDPQRVGLIGFSRTGMHVSYAVTFSKLTFAAATIADSVSNGLMGYMSWFGAEPPGPFAVELGIGGPFWGEERQLWLERSPNMNPHLVRSPLRFESYGRISFSNYWDMYTILRRHYRPAEMFHIPVATHLLQRPLARYASLQGNVDWFAFWLRGYEDPDPDKGAQYERWRKLRDQYCTILASEGEQDLPWYCEPT